MNVQAPRDFLDRRQLLSALRNFRRGDFTKRRVALGGPVQSPSAAAWPAVTMAAAARIWRSDRRRAVKLGDRNIGITLLNRDPRSRPASLPRMSARPR